MGARRVYAGQNVGRNGRDVWPFSERQTGWNAPRSHKLPESAGEMTFFSHRVCLDPSLRVAQFGTSASLQRMPWVHPFSHRHFDPETCTPMFDTMSHNDCHVLKRVVGFTRGAGVFTNIYLPNLQACTAANSCARTSLPVSFLWESDAFVVQSSSSPTVWRLNTSLVTWLQSSIRI